MNIANIFGLHLGCRVKFESGSGVLIYNIQKVCAFEEIIMTDSSFQYHVNFDRCKLLLKPLSAISEEDKAEFLNEFAPNKPAISHMGIECGIVYATYIDSTGELNYVDLNLEQSLWFASKSYDIGIVPDEYKEVEE